MEREGGREGGGGEREGREGGREVRRGREGGREGGIIMRREGRRGRDVFVSAHCQATCIRKISGLHVRMLSWLCTATILLEVPKQKTCMQYYKTGYTSTLHLLL